MMRKALLTGWLFFISCIVIWLFWYNEWKYTLPTPVPENYNPVSVGEHVKLEGKIALHENKPLFIHFFNPDCPCSRFNVPYFNSLVKKYSNQFSFIVVVINKAAGKTYSERQIQDKYQISVPVSFDQSIADACGTYSTPQAVILDASGNLYYRGNYNKSRFCTDTRSNYAQMAIDSFLNHHPHPMFNQYALKAYGCQLPKCTQ